MSATRFTCLVYGQVASGMAVLRVVALDNRHQIERRLGAGPIFAVRLVVVHVLGNSPADFLVGFAPVLDHAVQH